MVLFLILSLRYDSCCFTPYSHPCIGLKSDPIPSDGVPTVSRLQPEFPGPRRAERRSVKSPRLHHPHGDGVPLRGANSHILTSPLRVPPARWMLEEEAFPILDAACVIWRCVPGGDRTG
ncbi:hypothetical protein EYF80_065765 [Liparis tanakae]|uniref:Uncharacterized protein n=1 Tax=Liparis tanakae TaxID=230148 RepID=A0A4Z2E701_9TELE|nr:hypothetical protein EYF80_065765 [Liparis tanakae]